MSPKPKPLYLKPEHSGQRERWLISYTDFVTILLILFVAIAAQGLHSMQTPAKPPAPPPQEQAKPAPQAKALPQSAPQTSAQPKPQDPVLVQALEKLRAAGLDSHLEKRGLVISLPQAVLFPSGEDHIVSAAEPIVSQLADVIASVPNKVALVGHADSVPIHNKRFQNNWELSSARSVKLLELLTSRYGIDESRLSVQSDGSNDPKNSNDTEAGRAENRRVEILLLDQSAN
ncbi:MAG TPA: flagellar motor protein MotB [Bryobacteraceae bacterium]|nr:flagellar motor protein MotB [Bryobacteraceae bacterium]